MKRQTGYIGTYSPRGRGVYRFGVDLETGALSRPTLLFPGVDAKFVARMGDALAVSLREGERAGVALVDRRTPGRRLGLVVDESVGASFLLPEGEEWLWAVNFHEGRLLAYQMCHRGNSSMLQLCLRVRLGADAGCHQVLRHENRLLIPCMNQDRVAVLDRDKGFTEVDSLRFPAGSGPRHGVFDAAHEFLYFVTQFGHGVYAFRVGAEGFAPAGEAPIFPDAAPAGAETAAVRLSPDGRYLYVSTRGANVLTVFAVDGPRLRRVQQLPCGGDHPRDILPSSNGRFLLVLNRDSDNLLSFPLDPATGKIGAAVCEVAVPAGGCLA